MTTQVADISEATTFSASSETTADYGTTTLEEFVTTESADMLKNIHDTSLASNNDNEDDFSIAFDAFNILEIVMTSLELMLWLGAAIKMPRWRRNYRNQMLMQISVSRFIKRLVFTFQYLQKCEEITDSAFLRTFLNSSQIYIDFVIVILVFFFIKHMYDSLIIVLVKCRQNSLYKVSICAWLLPVPISAVWTLVIVFGGLKEKLVYLLICCIFRWPLIIMGTVVYIAVLIRVLSDKIRKFARSLTVVTFLMCLVINFYLVSKDIIKLWISESPQTKLLSYVSGFVMNLLILSLYVILITLDRKQSNKTSRNINSNVPDHSLNEAYNCK